MRCPVRWRGLGAVLGAVAAVAAGAGGAEAQERGALVRTADSLVPYVQGATGLTFQYAPRLGVRSRAQVREYVAEALARAFPEARLSAVAVAYHLLGRPEKCEALLGHLARHGADPAILARLLAQPLPPDLATRLRALPTSSDP